MAPAADHEVRMLVDGELIESDSGRTFDNVNPATEEVLGPVADASNAEMHRAIDAARRAFDETDWSTNRDRRKECLAQLQDALEKEREELREELILEVGCPRMTTHANQLDIPLDGALRYPIKLIDEFAWRSDMGGIMDRRGNPNTRQVWKEPVGVVGAIVPWNFPLEVTLNKLGQALATGNTVILKPAPDTPWNATRLGRLVRRADRVPAGRAQRRHVVGPPGRRGAHAVAQGRPDLLHGIDRRWASGSWRRARPRSSASSSSSAASRPPSCSTTPTSPSSVPSGVQVCFHAGQGCAIQTRMLLPRSRYEEGVEILKATLGSVAYGDPQRPDVVMGPVISAKQRERVLGYIEKGVAEGATLALGGGRPAHLPKGWFVEPTLFTDVDNSMTIAQEEIFGPVLVAIPYDDDDDAVRIANDSVYGLSGGVFSGSLERALGVAERIRTGSFSVNGGMPIGQTDMPFGGYKHSGIGRQNGLAGFDQYLETKSVAWPTPQ